MIRRKRTIQILINIFILCILANTLQGKEWKKVRIAVEGAYPPFSYIQSDGKIAGFDIDIAHALGEEMRIEIKLIQQEWQDMIPGLINNKYDAIIASMSIIDKRQKEIDCTEKYYQTPVKFIAPKGRFSHFSEQTIIGKKIGIQEDTTHDIYLSNVYGNKITIKRYATLNQAFLSLQKGEVHLLLADSAALYKNFAAKNIKYEFVGPDIINTKWLGKGVGIQVRKEDKNLREMFNKAISMIRRNGRYKEIQDKYFNFDIYGE